VISVHDWETIRLRCGRNKEPIKLVSRETGIAPNTIRKYLRQAERSCPAEWCMNRAAS